MKQLLKLSIGETILNALKELDGSEHFCSERACTSDLVPGEKYFEQEVVHLVLVGGWQRHIFDQRPYKGFCLRGQ